MNLKELKKMIKEEYSAYTEQAEPAVDVAPGDVDADMADDKEAEDMLRNIYDMLKAKFETEEEEMDMGDVEADEDMKEEADIEENSTTAAQYQKTGFAAGGKSSAGANVGYGNVGGKGGTGFDAKSIALQERLQKLANIIK